MRWFRASGRDAGLGLVVRDGSEQLVDDFLFCKIVLYPLEKSFRFIPDFQSKNHYASRFCVRLYLVGVTRLELVTSTV